MKTKYKYIHFEEFKPIGGDVSWQCLSNKNRFTLGFVEWYARWKKWQFVPSQSSAYTEDCLLDIADFMSQLEKPG